MTYGDCIRVMDNSQLANLIATVLLHCNDSVLSAEFGREDIAETNCLSCPLSAVCSAPSVESGLDREMEDKEWDVLQPPIS